MRLTESSGYPTLDRKTCALAKSRGRFDPAVDATGSAVAGFYRLATSWGIEQHQPTVDIAVPLEVSRVPPDYRTPVNTQLTFDASGHVTECAVTTSSGSAAADRAACAYLTSAFILPMPKHESPNVRAAVRYVTASLSAQPVIAQPIN